MSEVTCRKTEKATLRPPPAPERALEEMLRGCRRLDNTALEQRLTAWGRCRVSVARYAQEAELQTIRAAFPDSAALPSHVLHEVPARLDQPSQAFLRRVQRGEQAGFARFKGRNRFHAVAYKA
jgi:putative transposase